MKGQAAAELTGLTLGMTKDDKPAGLQVLAGLLAMAEEAVEALNAQLNEGGAASPGAVVGRLRGTGRGVSFSQLIAELEREHPLELKAPFEGSDRVSGAVWVASELIPGGPRASLAKLRWADRALDLPMHVHEHSDRFIIVHEGRGFFHVSDEPVDQFTGRSVRSIPARERDVFLFARGMVHTFSTDAEPMTLLSCQLPFISFDDPRQYRLPAVRWTAGEQEESYTPTVGCDPAWTVIGRQPPQIARPATRPLHPGASRATSVG